MDTVALKYELQSEARIYLGALDYESNGVEIQVKVEDNRAEEVKGCLLSADGFPLSSLKTILDQADSVISCQLPPRLLDHLKSKKIYHANISIYTSSLPPTVPTGHQLLITLYHPFTINSVFPNPVYIIPSRTAHQITISLSGHFDSLISLQQSHQAN